MTRVRSQKSSRIPPEETDFCAGTHCDNQSETQKCVGMRARVRACDLASPELKFFSVACRASAATLSSTRGSRSTRAGCAAATAPHAPETATTATAATTSPMAALVPATPSARTPPNASRGAASRLESAPSRVARVTIFSACQRRTSQAIKSHRAADTETSLGFM